MSWRRLLFAALLGATLSGVVFYAWLGSESGRSWFGHTLQSVSGGTIEIDGLHGQPLAQLEIDSLVFRQSGVAVEVKQLSVDWSPMHLLTGKVEIRALTMHEVQVQLSDVAQSQGKPASAMPPLAIALEALHIGTLAVRKEKAKPTIVSNIQLQHGLFSRRVSGELSAQLSQGELSLKLSGLLKNWKLRGELQHEKMNPLAFSLSGKGLRRGTLQLEGGTAAAGGSLLGNWHRDNDNIRGEGSLTLQTAQGQLQSSWQLDAPAAQAVHLTMQAQIDQAQIDQAEQAALLSRRLELAVDLRWAEEGITASLREKNLSLTLNYDQQQLAADLQLSRWLSPLAGLPGELSGRIKGSWQNSDWTLQADIDQSRLAGVPARMKLAASGQAMQWRISKLELQALKLKLSGSGKGDGRALQLKTTLQSGNLKPLLKYGGATAAAGKLRARISLDGLYGDPLLKVAARGEDIRFDGVAVDAIELSAHGRATQGDYKLTATALKVDGRQESDQVQISAGLKDETLKLNFDSSGKLHSSGKSIIRLKGFKPVALTLRQLQAAYENEPLLEIGRADINLAGDPAGDTTVLPKTPLYLMGEEGYLSLSLSPSRIEARLEIPAFHLAEDKFRLMHLPFHVEGTLAALMTLSGPVSGPDARVRLHAQSLAMKSELVNQKSEVMLTKSKVDMHYHDGNLSWELATLLPAEGVLSSKGDSALQFSLSPWRLQLPHRQQGAGSLTLKVGHLADIQPLFPRLNPIKGSADIALEWTMPVQERSVSARGNFSLAHLGVPELGLDLNGTMQVHSNRGRAGIELLLHQGEGKLSLQGPVDLEKRTIPEIHLSAFPLMQLPNQQFVVSGRISASETESLSLVKGELLVDKMRFEIPETAPSTTDDLMWDMEQLQPVAGKKPPLSKFDVNLQLNGDSEIYGHGMSLKPRGELHLGGSMTRPELSGKLEMASGKIEFRSVKLTIQPDSTVLFSGDAKRPFIHIRAARKVGDVLAGVIVEGPVDRLTTTLYSEPSMSNPEILSYVATGRPLSTLGTNGVTDLITTAEFIFGQGTMLQEMQGNIKQLTGLDIFEIGIEGSGGKIRAGQHLSDDITLSLEQTVANESTTALTLEYTLSKSLSVFSRQTIRMAPLVGLRYGKEWFGTPEQSSQEEKK